MKCTKSGKAVATNTIALDDGWGDNKRSYFIPIVVWEKQAESLANYTNKGSKIAVNGKLTSRSYETQDGQKRTVIEVVANQYGGIEFLDAKNNGGGVSSNQTSNNANAQQNRNNAQSDPFGNSSIDISDDSLPF
ncbi:single-stranded DNA-binding protein [Enterococcus gallinarum]|uniref:Single-stranded DNA-binding protein n=1 Tax=Enterococcus gallinarum TaxID=1353 RepID=A0ABD4ZSM1_ENTGA|nr:single-stranded DNA-binding protein [Enterococcus gallinarum]MDL4874438.1 single-stranded DNA-binding protein [Enterococcus gallinarum]MDL4880793.1 single-stranded DNA-binding protein [Enterococcus gallinarum]MDL4884340.1 single-stranded DNA-binding protein [Enterococcus gallinarum]MDL4893070.1 single-stranded DNA-binding protein [Enterococcus gallinarum]MDL4920022.1 single-stranded DNA-binding protein [Enterococcus gallinarum]